MVYVNFQYFNLNRILLLIIGLWPYQQSKLVRIQMIFFLIIIMSSIVFQLTTFVTTKYTVDHVLTVFPNVLFSSIYLIKYVFFCFKNHYVKYLLEQFQSFYSKLKDEKEIAIVENYWCQARNYTIRLTLFAMFSLFLLIAQSLWQCIFNVTTNINGSRPYITIQIVTEYFVDEEKYIYLILLHTNIVFCVGAAVTIGTATMFMACMKHACGMFRVASYRMEHVTQINILRNKCLKNEIITCQEIICAVKIHREAVRYSKFFISSFESLILSLVAVGVLCLSLNLFRMISSANDIDKLTLNVLCIVSLFTYMFLAHYAAQEVMDHNDHVFFTVYNFQWYSAPLNVQRMILFLLQIGTRPFTLKLGGLCTGSIETFSTMASATLSYFTFLYSAQQ